MGGGIEDMKSGHVRECASRCFNSSMDPKPSFLIQENGVTLYLVLLLCGASIRHWHLLEACAVLQATLGACSLALLRMGRGYDLEVVFGQ